MTFTLGYTPEKFKVIVAAGADFYAALTRSDDTDWPASSVLTLDFGEGTLWEATLSGATAQWNVDQVDVDVLIARRPRGVKLWYVDGATRLLWAHGSLVTS